MASPVDSEDDVGAASSQRSDDSHLVLITTTGLRESAKTGRSECGGGTGKGN